MDHVWKPTLAMAALPSILAKDPSSAATLLSLLPTDKHLDGIQKAMAQFAKVDLTLARTSATELGGKLQRPALNAVAREWAKSDPEVTLAWALSLGCVL